MKYILIEFWRDPKPNCNWCPRIAILLDENGMLIKAFDNHDYLKSNLEKEYGIQIVLCGQYQLTKAEFKRIKEKYKD